MPRYAAKTQVSADRSKVEIERTLMRYGADKFLYGSSRQGAAIGFVYNGRAIRMELPLPDIKSFSLTPAGKYERTKEQAYKAWEQACRQRWRALALTIKAKLEGIEAGILNFEKEFLAYTCLPDGSTVADFMEPQITAAIETGKMPQNLLPGI